MVIAAPRDGSALLEGIGQRARLTRRFLERAAKKWEPIFRKKAREIKKNRALGHGVLVPRLQAAHKSSSPPVVGERHCKTSRKRSLRQRFVDVEKNGPVLLIGEHVRKLAAEIVD